MFEPASEFHDALRANYASMDYVLVPAALSDQEGRGYPRKIAIDGNKISHSWLVDEASDGSLEIVTTMRLDSFMSTRDDAKPYLLKLDVDGLEIPIMQGSEGIWDDVSCVIVEATIASFAERMNYLLAKGFKLFDIVDHCYYYGMFSQVDLVFVAENHWENPDLRPGKLKNSPGNNTCMWRISRESFRNQQSFRTQHQNQHQLTLDDSRYQGSNFGSAGLIRDNFKPEFTGGRNLEIYFMPSLETISHCHGWFD